MKNELKHILSQAGLNKVETAVFLANLETGSAAASAIAKVAGQNRVTAYEALKRLSKKGLVKIRAKKNSSVKYFVPESVEVLREKLEEKQQELGRTIELLASRKKEFDTLFTLIESKPEVLFYEGKEGIKTVLLDTLKQKPVELLSYASLESLESGYEDKFLQNYWNQRSALQIPARGILPGTQKTIEFFNAPKNQREMRRVRFLPEKFNFKNEVDIYGDSIGITSHAAGNEYGVIIRSKSMAENMRIIFEAMWEMLSS